MGKTTTPRYVIKDERGNSYGAWYTTAQYGRRGYGRPTVQNLMRWRDGYNLSLCQGGANEHIGANGWIQRLIYIYDQYTHRRVVSYNPPAFEVIPTAEAARKERDARGLFTYQTATA